MAASSTLRAVSSAPPEDRRVYHSDADLERFRRSFADQGYLVFRNVVSKEKLSQVRTRIMDEFERQKRSGDLFSGGGLISGHLNCFPGEEARFVYETLQERGVVDVIRAVMPKVLGKINLGCNLNFPGSVAQHYHVDGLFLEDFLVVNIAVVDTDLANGAIDVLPGTHREFYKYWRFAAQRLHRGTTRIAMHQGDVLLRTSNLWHRGMPNYTDVVRPMLAVTFGETRGVPDEEAFRMNDGKILFEPNWYKTDFMGRIRERTFVKVPITYAAYRFVRSLYGNKGYAAW